MIPRPVQPPALDLADIQRAVVELCRRDVDKTILQSQTLYVNWVPGSGVILEQRVRPGGAAGPSMAPQPLHMIFRGEWHPDDSYSYGDVVIIYGGLNAGTYICTALAGAGTAEPGTAPVSVWTQICQGFFPRVWE